MSTVGYGYGSEWHFLRYLAYHRTFLIERLNKLGGFQHVDFLDFPFAQTPSILHDDSEYGGIDFLDERRSFIESDWKLFWPQSGNPPKWDAVAKAWKDHRKFHYLLFEAKAHVKEIQSSCQASNSSKQTIERAFEQTRHELNIETKNDWKEKYYQQANRIALCNFLNKHDISTYIVNIYFTGERSSSFPSNPQCPATKDEWMLEIENQNNYLGIKNRGYDKLLNVFLHINGDKQI